MNTIFDKIWDAHAVAIVRWSNTMYIDRMYHEVTSPQAFDGLRARRLQRVPSEKNICMPDHNIPTLNKTSQYVTK